jgi:tryptophan synthase alpha chain
MSHNRLAQRFDEARGRGRRCLLPYVTAGYPNLTVTTGLLRRFDELGCPAVEVGFPFSDSIADGPVIQDSFYRALAAGFRVDELFQRVRDLRAAVSAGLLAMVSMSIVQRIGLDDFVRRAGEVGFDGLIVPDVPVDESDGLADAAQRHRLCNVLMAAPTSSPQRRQAVGQRATGFVYLIAARGITGERQTLADDLVASIQAMRAVSRVPVVVGFGISTPLQVREVCRHADGVIVGSAIIRRITAAIGQERDDSGIVDDLGQYVADLMEG